MCIAGGLGIPGTRKERSTSRNVFAGVFMGFSITSAVFGGIILIFYSIAINNYRYYYDHDPHYIDYGPTEYYYRPTEDYYRPTEGYHHDRYGRERRHTFDAEMVVSVIILILGIGEFAIGIWAAVCLCVMKPCTCCYGNPQQGQVMYPPNSSYATAQYPGGAPVAVPIQAVTPGPQGMVGNQPQFAQIATSGAMTTGFQPQFAQVATPEAIATDYQHQMPPIYGHGGYMKLQNDDSPVNT